MPYPVNTFANFADLLAYINNYWITNGVEEIDAVIGNDVVNGLLTFVEQSPLNWQKAQLINTTGAATAARPVVVFMTNTPSSISFPTNIYNQYIFINTTSGAIPLLSPAQYYDINLAVVTSIPAKSIVNICQASNSLWIQSGIPSATPNPVLPLFKFVVDSGDPDNPVSGTSVWQSDLLIGLGSDYNNQIQFVMDNAIWTNYGGGQNCIYDPVAGTIDINFGGSGNTWQGGSGGSIDLNQ